MLAAVLLLAAPVLPVRHDSLFASPDSLVTPARPVQDGPHEVSLDLRLEDGTLPKSATVRVSWTDVGDGKSVRRQALLPWTAASKALEVPAASVEATVYGNLLELEGGDGTESELISASLEIKHDPVRTGAIAVELFPRTILRVELDRQGAAAEVEDRFGQAVVVIPKPSPVKSRRRRSVKPEQALARAALRRIDDSGAVKRYPRAGKVRYVFDLEPGPHFVGYVDDRPEALAIETIEVGDGTTDCRLRVEVGAIEGDITLRCIDSNGESVEASKFHAVIATANSSRLHNSIPFEPRGPGVYVFARSEIDVGALADESRNPKRDVELRFQAGEYGEQAVKILPGRSDYEVVLRARRDIALRVVGDSAPKFVLRIACPGTREDHLYVLQFGVDLSLEKIQGRELIVEWIRPRPNAGLGLFRRDRGKQFCYGITVHSQTVDLDKADGPITLEAPRTYSLDLDVSAFDPKAPVQLTGALDSAPGVQQRTPRENRVLLRADEQGHAKLDGLTPGRYVVQVGFFRKPFEVDLGADLAVVVPRVDANGFRVTVEDPLGALGSYGLRTDDVMVGDSDGRFSSEADMRSFLERIAKEPTIVLIERDGSPLEVELEPLGDRDTWGGTLEPSFPE